MILLMFLVVVLTFVVGGVTLKARLNSVKQGQVSIGYFRLMQGSDVPPSVVQSTRCLNNMFEVPVLFYLACTLFLVLDITNTLALIAAVIFVISRYWHSYIHLTYNNVVHRMNAFWVGCLAVAVMWIDLLIAHTFQL